MSRNETRFEYEGKRVCVSKKETEIDTKRSKRLETSASPLSFKFLGDEKRVEIGKKET